MESSIPNYQINRVETSFSAVDGNGDIKDTGFHTSQDHYHLGSYDHIYQGVTERIPANFSWCTLNRSVGVISLMKDFRDVSTALNTSGNIQDLRILSLYCVFAFSSTSVVDRSVTKYMGHAIHDSVMKDLLPITAKSRPRIFNNISDWCDTLIACSTSWIEVTNQCINILDLARQSDDVDDLVAASCLFRLAPRLVNSYVENVCEDTFVHMYLDGLLDGIFATEPLLKQEW